MKTKEEIFEMITASPVFHLGTVANGKPHVRGMLLYKADERGIIFHTGDFKDLYKQLKANPEIEMCFNHKGEQIRIAGEVTEDNSPELIEEIYNHPTRGFLRSFGESIKGRMGVFKMEKAKVATWKMETNFEPTLYFDI